MAESLSPVPLCLSFTVLGSKVTLEDRHTTQFSWGKLSSDSYPVRKELRIVNAPSLSAIFRVVLILC